MGMNIVFVIFSATFVVSSSAAAQSYDTFDSGRLTGKVIVEWYKPDIFIFTPDPKRPLVFTRKNGDQIVPGRMLTDGGSIPRPLWMLPKFSPWGYGPAFVVHDWLFAMHHCQYKGYEKYDHHIAATVMAEVMKTMMESKMVEGIDPWTLDSMYWAVNSTFAQQLWDKGKCDPPPSEFTAKVLIQTFKIDMDQYPQH